MCPCKKKTMDNQLPPPIVSAPEPTVKSEPPKPTRSGACPYCLRKHLLKAAGYAEEMREEPNREWEREKLLQNLLLAEDHAEALGDWNLRSAIRAERLPPAFSGNSVV